MAINLATKYSQKIDERFTHSSFTDVAAGHDYDMTGVKEIKIYDASPATLGNYTRSGQFRYGTINDLDDQLQTMTIANEKAFTFSVDAANDAQQLNIKQINARLKSTWDEVVCPAVDKYRLQSWASARGVSGNEWDGTTPFAIQTKSGVTVAKNTIIDEIFEGNAALDNKLVPASNRYLFIGTTAFVKAKLSDVILGGDQLNKESVTRGFKGTLDSLNVIVVPDSYMPVVNTKNVHFMIKYKNATVDPMQLKTLRVHKNPIGIDGDVAEGHFIYDSFVLNNKAKGIYIATA